MCAAVVRNVTASLSCTLAERLRISGTWAFRGLPSFWSDDTQVSCGAAPPGVLRGGRKGPAGYQG
jgi:hypothetical protein